jgi:hypothetical protein
MQHHQIPKLNALSAVAITMNDLQEISDTRKSTKISFIKKINCKTKLLLIFIRHMSILMAISKREKADPRGSLASDGSW